MSNNKIITPPADRPSKAEEAKPYLKSFHSLFVDKCMANADKVGFVDAVSGREVTYKQALGTAKRLAGFFYDTLGVRKGDVIGIMIPNICEWVSVFQAIISLGAIASPLNSLFSASEIEKQIKLGNLKALVCVSHFGEQVAAGAAAAAEAGTKAEVLVLDKSPVMLPTTEVPPVPADYVVDPQPEDVIALPFSSGTTGLPKGVQLTNANLSSNLFQTSGAIEFNEQSVVMAVLPYFHIYGMIAILHGTIFGGGKQIVMPKFDLEAYLGLVAQHKATHLFVAPPIIVGFIKHPKTKEIDTSSVKYVISGAAPLGEDVQRMCEPLFPNALVGQGYGLTETSPVISISPPGKNYGSAGTLVADTEIRIVKVAEAEGEENVNLGPGEGEGELWVRGPQVMKGYLREEDTAIVFPEPGWFRTGDLVKIDEAGNITVTDRIKELIKYKGYQVAPAELEAVIQTCPLVQECIVIGIADKEEGAGNEVPKAHVVLKPTVSEEDRATAAETIKEFVDSKVAPYKKLRGGVKIVDAIPKTASGKLLRRLVRDQENKPSAAAAPAEAVEKEDTLDYFLEICDQFKLGRLPTESSHPMTEKLSSLAQEDLPAALNVLAQVDYLALSTAFLNNANVVIPQLEELAQTIDSVFTAGRQVFCVGCGATGRLSISLEAFSLDGMVPEEEYRDRVKGFMAGGDAALIRSIEKFEDRNEYGKKQLHELNFQDGDLLLAITEGGETPFVIAACEEAVVSSPSQKPYFLYCNPDDILCEVAERSERVIMSDDIKKINLTCGNMAITGSTRMQATSIQLLAAGLAIQHHANPAAIGPAIRKFAAAVKGTRYSDLAPLTIAEAELYRNNEAFLYETDYFSMTCMTDTTERAPTFSLPPFESFNEGSGDRTTPVYLTLTGTSSVEDSWKRLLRRDWRPLEWDDTKNKTGLKALSGYDFSPNVLDRRRAVVGYDKTRHRIHVRKTESGIHFTLKQEGRTDSRLPLLSLAISFGSNLDENLATELNKDLLLVNVWAKMLLNAHSTLIQGINERIMGNVMTFVKPSNYKLIDRAARYVQLVLQRSGKFRKPKEESSVSPRKSKQQVEESKTEKEPPVFRAGELEESEEDLRAEFEDLVEHEVPQCHENLEKLCFERKRLKEKRSKLLGNRTAALANPPSLNKASIKELSALTKPPAVVEQVVSVVLEALDFKFKKTWGVMSTYIRKPEFLNTIKSFDFNTEPSREFKAGVEQLPPVDQIKKISLAAATLAEWASIYNEVSMCTGTIHGVEDFIKNMNSRINDTIASLEQISARLNSIADRFVDFQEKVPEKVVPVLEEEEEEEEQGQQAASATAGGEDAGASPSTSLATGGGEKKYSSAVFEALLKNAEDKSAAVARVQEAADALSPVADAARSALDCVSAADRKELAALKAPAKTCLSVVVTVCSLLYPSVKPEWNLLAPKIKKPDFQTDLATAANNVLSNQGRLPASFVRKVADLPDPETVKRTSGAAAGLAEWACAMIAYAKFIAAVSPMRAFLADDGNAELLAAACNEVNLDNLLSKYADATSSSAVAGSSPAVEEENNTKEADEEKKRAEAEAEAAEAAKLPMPDYEVIVAKIFELRGIIDPTDPIVVKVSDAFLDEVKE